jgi:hypothetical protein
MEMSFARSWLRVISLPCPWLLASWPTIASCDSGSIRVAAWPAVWTSNSWQLPYPSVAHQLITTTTSGRRDFPPAWTWNSALPQYAWAAHEADLTSPRHLLSPCCDVDLKYNSPMDWFLMKVFKSCLKWISSFVGFDDRPPDHESCKD